MLTAREFKEYVHGTAWMREKKQFNFDEAKQIGDVLGMKWNRCDIEQFAMGLNVELEHGLRDAKTDVTHDEPMLTGKITLAHLNEIPDYYTRLAVMEHEAECATSK